MPNARTASEIINSRIEVLAPLFAFMDGKGIKRTWLAHKIGISPTRLGHYEHGRNEAPQWVIERACLEVGFPLNKLHLPPPSAKRSWKNHVRVDSVPAQKGA